MNQELKKVTIGFLALFIILNIYAISKLYSDSPTITPKKSKNDDIAEKKTAKIKSFINSQSKKQKTFTAHNKEEDLKYLVIKDQVCEVIKRKAEIHKKIGFKIMLEAYDLPESNQEYADELFEIFANENPLTGNVNKYPRTESTDFFNAMLLSAQLPNALPAKPDFYRALEIFENLEETAPNNSAYTLYKANLMYKMGKEPSEIKLELLKAFSKPTFNAHIQKIKKAVLERGFTNTSFFIIANEINQNIRLPMISQLKSLILPFLKSSESYEFLSSAMRFSTVLLSLTQHEKSLRGLEYWTVNEFSLGRSLYFKAWKTLYPTWKPPKGRTEEEYKAFHTSPIADSIIKMDLHTKKCNRQELDQIFYNARKNYIEANY